MGCKEVFETKTFRSLMAILGIATSIAIIIVAIFGLIGAGIKLKSVIGCVYQIIFGLILLVAELRVAIFFKWFRFMIPFIGLGASYIFVAAFTIQQAQWYQILVACVAAALGVVNCIFFCFKVDRGIYLNGQDPRRNSPAGPGEVAQPAGAGKGTARAAPPPPSQPNPFENDNPFSSSARS